MKFVRLNKGRFTFGLGRNEKNLLFRILQLYPLVPPAHHRLTKSGDGVGRDENQRLLEDALAEQRRSNRKQVLAMLNEAGRFTESGQSLQFSLTAPEMEWFLQVMNDVRVGAWLALGEPDEIDFPEVTKANAPYLLAMETAGHFEAVLLDALGLRNPKPTDLA